MADTRELPDFFRVTECSAQSVTEAWPQPSRSSHADGNECGRPPKCSRLSSQEFSRKSYPMYGIAPNRETVSNEFTPLVEGVKWEKSIISTSCALNSTNTSRSNPRP